MNFVHLQVHSEYSFKQAPVRISALLKKAKELGQNAIALTDHGFMFGILDFYMEMDKKKELSAVKRILGCHIYLDTDNAKTNDKSSYNRLTLLAQNDAGYKNLMKISSERYTHKSKWQEFPSVSMKFLSQHTEGLIAIAGDLASRFGRDVCGNIESRAKRFLDDLCKIFDYEHLYFSLQNHNLDEEETVNDFLRNYAKENNRQLVVTNNVHYITRKDSQIHKALLCMEQKKKLAEYNDEYFSEKDEFYLKSAEEMYNLFPNDLEALENTVKIAERCNVKLATKVGSAFWPRFECPAEFANEYDYLEYLVKEKIHQRYSNGLNDEKIMERVSMELATIKQINVPGYFLIIQDFIMWAKENGIPMGPGRGSAAGSIIAYILGITELDPLPYGLLFERFLNPERVSMPDIDIDVSDKDRQKLITYITNKYGEENTMPLVTYGRMKAKAVLAAAGRVLDMSISDVQDNFSKRIPEKKYQEKLTDETGKEIKGSDEINLANVRFRDKELDSLIESAEVYKELWNLAVKLEGLIYNSGKHAAALIIAPCNVIELAPFYRLKADEAPIVQYDKHYVEDIGLLKMDILGLRNLSMIQETLEAVKKTKKLNIDIDKIPLGDEKTFDIYKYGNTIGTFQFESTGMRKYLRDLKPNRIEDLIAMNALFRPGPMDHIPRYIRCKNGQEPINCYHKNLENVLGETYGVIVFQEQVMHMAQILAGFSLGKADNLRRAMGKKNAEEMAKMKPDFFKNGMERGYEESLLQKIWTDLEPFCDYAFNKSHSATYSYVAYQTAYLKANFPAEYMAAVMSCEKMKKLPIVVDECKRMGIEVLPPDVNKSKSEFSVEGKAIRWGLSQIKGCGEVVARDIELERKNNGNYKSLFDMVRRLHLFDKTTINKIALESLAKAGALDSLPGTRAQKFASVEKALADAPLWKIKKQSAQMSFFGPDTEEEPALENTTEWSFADTLLKERQQLWVQVSAHPLDEYYPEIRGFADLELSDQKKLNEKIDSIVKIAALVEHISERETSKGKIGILNLQDKNGKLEACCWAEKWKTISKNVYEGMLVMVSGKLTISNFNNKPQIMLNSLEYLDNTIKHAKTFYIQVNSDFFNSKQNADIEKFFNENKKEKGASFYFKILDSNGYQYNMETNKYKIQPTRENLKKLVSVFGAKNVWASD